LFLIYAIVYGIGRFGLEFLRLDPAPLGTFNVNQMIMLGVAIVCGGILVFRHRKSASNL
ncbi:MAG: prolipoprotein diacylglyceryl transferase, partial [Anaerolineae bacterium]|nr:prolipoprotein diacylglyceryl transferase [Anaerolineae bacterium]